MIIRGSIETLPIEVLEEVTIEETLENSKFFQVFSYLEDPDVVSAASVCLHWAGQYIVYWTYNMHIWHIMLEKLQFCRMVDSSTFKRLIVGEWLKMPTTCVEFLCLCRCVPAGGQVQVQREHPRRHPHWDSLPTGESGNPPSKETGDWISTVLGDHPSHPLTAPRCLIRLIIQTWGVVDWVEVS